MPKALMANRVAVSYSTPNGRTIASTNVDKEACCVCAGGGGGVSLDPPFNVCNCVPRPPHGPCEYGKTPCLIPTATLSPPLTGRFYKLRIDGKSVVQSSYYNDFMAFVGISPKSHSYTHTYNDTELFRIQWCGGGMGLSKQVTPDPPPGFTGLLWSETTSVTLGVDTCKSFDTRDPFRGAVPRVWEPPDPLPGFATSEIPTRRIIRPMAKFGVSARTMFRIYDNGQMTFVQHLARIQLQGAYDVETRESVWSLEYGPGGEAWQINSGPPVCCGEWEANVSVAPFTGHANCSPGVNFSVSASWKVETPLGARASGFGIWSEGAVSSMGFVKLNLHPCEDPDRRDSGECATCGGLSEGVAL